MESQMSFHSACEYFGKIISSGIRHTLESAPLLLLDVFSTRPQRFPQGDFKGPVQNSEKEPLPEAFPPRLPKFSFSSDPFF